MVLALSTDGSFPASMAWGVFVGRFRSTLLFAFVLLCPTARAVPCHKILRFSNAFNLVAQGSAFCRNSDIEGRAFVVGNASFDSYSVAERSRFAKTPYDWALLVGGALRFSNGTVWDGTVGFGRSLVAPETVRFVRGARKVDLRALTALLDGEWKRARQALSEAPVNTPFVHTNDRLVVEASRTDVVVEVPATLLAETREIVVRAPQGATAVVRVVGGEAVLSHAGFSIDPGLAARTLFYFADARKLKLQNVGIRGSIFAPLADLSFDDGVVFGNVYVRDFRGTGQINQTETEGCFAVPVAPPLPEPGPKPKSEKR